MVLDEKAAIHARLKLKGRSAPPLWGRMTEAQRAEDSRVEALIDWRKVGTKGGRVGRERGRMENVMVQDKACWAAFNMPLCDVLLARRSLTFPPSLPPLLQISENLRQHHPKRLRSTPRPILELLTHWKNKVSVPPTFTAEEKERLRRLVEQHEEHEWEEVAIGMGTGHSGIQCLREFQRGGGEGGGGGALAAASSALIKRGPWTRDEDGRLAAAVGMYADNWSLVSDHVATRTASQCRHRQSSLLMDKTPFSREEQKRLILATKAYAPEVWEVMTGKQRPTESNLVPQEGGGSGGYWSHIARHLPGRTDGQCRSRWYQTFHPLTNRGDWGKEEVGRLKRLVEAYGPDWVKIAGEIGTGRTRQQVKQMWARMMRAEAKQTRKREKEEREGKEKEEMAVKKRKKGGATEDYEDEQGRGVGGGEGDGEGGGEGGKRVSAAKRNKGGRPRKPKPTAAEVAAEKRRKVEQARERRASGRAKTRKGGRGMSLEEEESGSSDEEGKEEEEEEEEEEWGKEEEGGGAGSVKGKRRRRGSMDGGGGGVRGGRGGGREEGGGGVEQVTGEMGELTVTTRTRRGRGREGRREERVESALPTVPLPPLDEHEQEAELKGV